MILSDQEPSNVVEMAPPVKENPLDNDAVNNAAYQFQTNIRTAKSRIFSPSIGKNALQRVFSAVLEFPLADVDPRFRDKNEHELFVLSLTLLSAKDQMLQAVMKAQKENGENTSGQTSSSEEANEGSNVPENSENGTGELSSRTDAATS